MRQLTLGQKNLINEYLSQHLGASTVILFGSAAKGRMREDSDIDIAFLSESKLTSYDIFLAAQELADRLKSEVDLIDFQQASTIFKAQIVNRGIVILDRQPTARHYAYMRALKEYAMFNDERRCILERLGYGGGQHG